MNNFKKSFGRMLMVFVLAVVTAMPLESIYAQTDTARVGQLIYIPGSRTVYLVGNGGLYGFPNAAVFYSWNFTFSQILIANTSELALAMLGVVPTKLGGCGTPLDQINGVCGEEQSVGSTISGLNPASGPVGTLVTITGSGFTATGNNIKMGNYSVGSYNSTDGATLAFTVPSSFSNCNSSSTACTNMFVPISSADYSVTVSNSNGTSGSKIFTITNKLLCPEMMCAAPPAGYYYLPTPGVCGCGTLTPNNQ